MLIPTLPSDVRRSFSLPATSNFKVADVFEICQSELPVFLRTNPAVPSSVFAILSNVVPES